MKNQDRMMFDIDKHFGERLNTVIHDTVDTCRIADFEGRETIKLVFTGLFYELIRCSAILHMNEEDFIHGCRIAYRTMIKHARKTVE